MNELVRGWLAKAEGDYRTAGRELNAADAPNYDAVCFHAQQAIEKYMKALLLSRGHVPPRSHDLLKLEQLLSEVCPGWFWATEELRFLNVAAVEFRYPGESAELPEAQEAYTICNNLRSHLLPMIGPL